MSAKGYPLGVADSMYKRHVVVGQRLSIMLETLKKGGVFFYCRRKPGLTKTLTLAMLLACFLVRGEISKSTYAHIELFERVPQWPMKPSSLPMMLGTSKCINHD